MSVYLIDGYNLLHEIVRRDEGSDAMCAADLEEERRRLVDRVAGYIGATADRAIVVFDSSSKELQKPQTASRQLEVVFGSFARSADSIIEREVYALSAGENVIVVSSDYQLQKVVFLPNVERRSSRQFAQDLQDHTKKIANSDYCIRIGHRIEERIDSQLVEKLKALRDGSAEPAGEPALDDGSATS